MITCHSKHLVDRCLQRGYTLDEAMSCVVSQDGDMWTIDTDHPAFPREKIGALSFKCVPDCTTPEFVCLPGFCCTENQMNGGNDCLPCECAGNGDCVFEGTPHELYDWRPDGDGKCVLWYYRAICDAGQCRRCNESDLGCPEAYGVDICPGGCCDGRMGCVCSSSSSNSPTSGACCYPEMEACTELAGPCGEEGDPPCPEGFTCVGGICERLSVTPIGTCPGTVHSTWPAGCSDGETQSACESGGGTWKAGKTCAENPCGGA